MFIHLQQKVKKQLDEMITTGTLFRVDVDPEKVWNLYLDSFPIELRQENTCSCCKSFIRMYAGIVAIKDNKKISLWDFDAEDEEYNEAIKALKKYVHSLPIKGIFLNTFAKCGTNKNVDSVRNVVWNHFYLELPKVFVKPDIGPLEATALDNKNVLMRSLKEITDDAVDTVIELIGQNSLYRGNEFLAMLKEFKGIKVKFKKVPAALQDNFCWVESGKVSGAVTRIRNTSIGTLLNDLSDGVELDKAVTSFERVVAPSNYKRPTALVTPKMIDAAQKRLEELGLINALNRRLLSDKDLNVNNTLYVDRPKITSLNVFDEMKKDVVVNPKSFSKVEEIHVDDFVKNVLPTSKSIKVLVENNHLGNFVSLVGPKEENENHLFKWNNDFSWNYSGSVADSMRARVVELGGRVDGVLRFTHSWNHPEVGRNGSLMDLHVFLPGSSEHRDGIHNNYPTGQRVGWNNRTDSISGGRQDVDYTNIAPEGHIPLENITFPDMKKLKDGKYTFKIHNWSFREPTKSGFKAEIEFGGQVFQYNHPAPLKNHQWVTLAEVTLKNGVFTIDHKLESKATSQKKWNIDTERWHKVKAITYSPNHWTDKGIGNKHLMFFLENCKTDENSRGFYNEFLKEDLMKDRKVFEVLAGKITVEGTENELSGLGFSDTVRNEMVVEVESKFKRVLRIKF